MDGRCISQTELANLQLPSLVRSGQQPCPSLRSGPQLPSGLYDAFPAESIDCFTASILRPPPLRLFAPQKLWQREFFIQIKAQRL